MDFDTKYHIPFKYKVNHSLTRCNLDTDLFMYKTAVNYNKLLEFFNDWKNDILNKINFELCKSSKN